MKEFKPKINRSLFKERILNNTVKEGNNAEIAKQIDKKIKETCQLNFFEDFMELCSQYQIKIHASIVEHWGKKLCKIKLMKNGYKLYHLNYQDPDKDISIELADKLYYMLWEQINIQLFIKNIRK